MKKLYTLVAAVLLTAISLAQSPEKMSYQAVVRDSGDALVANQAVGMQISILQGSAVGTSVYTETHSLTTNINGLVSFEIGNGMIVSGTFAAIDWSAGPYFIKTETDPTGGNSYSITGTSQLLSVPFALYSANTAGLDLKADKASPTLTGDVVFDTNGVSFNAGNVAFDNGQTFVRSAQVFNSAENFFYGPSVEFNTAANFATGTLKILNSPQTAGSVLTDVNGDGIATWQSPTAGSIADGSITEVKLAFDTATQDELDLKAPLLNPSFTGNITTIGDGSGMFYELNPAANYFKFQGNNHAKMSGAAWLSLQIGAVDKLLVTGSSVIAKDDFIAETNIETPSIKVTGGSLIIGNVLTSDASGNATWQAPIAGSIADGSITEAKLAFDTATQAELNALLDGAIKTNSDNIQFIMGPGGPIDNLTYGQSTNTDNITTNSNAIIAKANLANPTFTGIVTTPALKVASGAGVNKVLTSDASGNATWQTATAGSIADGSITVAKLSTSVNTSLDLADTSVQPAALNAKANIVSPAFTTPSLGVATATSINGVVLVNGGDDAAYLNAQGTYTVPAGGAAPTTYVVGSNYAELGGIVVWVSSNGQHGLVVEASDMNNTPVTWYNAQNLISEPSNHYGAANQFRDWRLPTKFELTEIYSLFGTSLWGWYWTSTEVNSLTAFALELNGGGPVVDYQWAKDRTTNSNVRAVRAF